MEGVIKLFPYLNTGGAKIKGKNSQYKPHDIFFKRNMYTFLLFFVVLKIIPKLVV